MKRKTAQNVFKAKTKRNHNEKLWINIVYENETSHNARIAREREIAMNVEKREHRLGRKTV
jgi:hypothetical protein